MSTRTTLVTGAVLLALAVILGAFGAHLVQDRLTAERYDVYRTAVEYHFYHSLGLLILGVVTFHLQDCGWLRWSGRLMLSGVLLFSGSLYLLTLTGTTWLAAVTPFGGLAFITGWILLAGGVWRSSDSAR